MSQSPFYSPIRVNQSDFSGITRGAESYGRSVGAGLEKLGDAVGKVASSYFEEKAFEEQASDFMMTPQGRKFMDARKLNIENKDDALKHIKGAINNAGGFKEFMSQLQSEMQMQQADVLEERQNYLFEQQKLSQQGETDHYNRMSQEVMNPEYESVEKEISGLRSSMRDLAETTEDPSSKEYSGRINSYLSDIKKKQDQLGQINKTMPMYELNPEKFNVAYGQTDNPYQMKHKMNTLQMLQKREDSLGNNNYDILKKQAETKNLLDQEKAEVAFNEFRDIDPYVFDESDRMRKVMDFGLKREAQFSKDQREDMAKSIRFIDPEDVASSKKSIFDRYKVGDQDSIIESATDLNALLNSDNPVADGAAVEKFARILQPTGLLTEDDINRAGGSKGFEDRMKRAYEQLATGKLSNEAKDDLRAVSNLFLQRASERKYLNIEKTINEVAKKYDTKPEDIRERFFSEDAMNIPTDQLKRIKGEGGGKMMKVKHQGKMVEGEVTFEFKDGKKLVRLPNGEEKVY